MKKKIAPILGSITGLTLFSVALWVLHQELRQFHFNDIMRDISALPASSLILAGVLTVLNYASLTFYDMLGFQYIGKTLSKARIALTSFIAYAFSNNIGLFALSGGAVRYRLYAAWGLSSLDITRLIVFCSILTFWLGLLTICAVVFIVAPVPVPLAFHLPFSSIRFVGIVFAFVLLVYLVWTRTKKNPIVIQGWEFPMPRVTLSLSLLATACVDWLLFGATLYVLLPQGHNISFMTFMSVVLVAQLAAMISHVPGGIGIFEVVILLLMPDVGTSKVMGTLVVFRTIYYLLPLCLAALLFGAYELFKRREVVTDAAIAMRQATLAVIPYFASFLTFLAGVVLQFSGATPAIEERMKWLMLFLPLPVMEISHLVGSIVGMVLLLLSWGIYRRLDGAYHLVLYLLSTGVIFSLLKGADYEEAIILAAILMLFWPCRKHFYRKTSFLNERFSRGWILAIALVLVSVTWAGFFSYRHVEYSNTLWWQFSFDAHASHFLRASIGGVMVLMFFSFLRLLRIARFESIELCHDDIQKVRIMVQASTHTYGNLAFLGDKSFLFGRNDDAFIMYAEQGGSWIAMGDPIGQEESCAELVWNFCERADTYNGRAVFYEIGVDNLPLYLDVGLTLLKLGEEARVDLSTFNLEGGSKKGLRHTRSKLEREGLSFEILPSEEVPANLPLFQEISDNWLLEKHAREKRFSLGFFSPEYICGFPVAVVKQKGVIIAFSNIWKGASGSELSIDLMRYNSSAPSGVMDYLFISLMEWGKKTGYQWFNLGMAPFSGFEARSLAPVWNKFGSFLFSYGENFYNFQGVRQYKEKFDPVWTPRYLATPGGLSLPLVLKDLSALISGGVKGVFAK